MGRLRELSQLRTTPGQPREYINAFEELVLRGTSIDDDTKRLFFFNGLDKQTRDALIAVEDAPLQEPFEMLERLGGRQRKETANPASSEKNRNIKADGL